MSINEFVITNNLQAADAIELQDVFGIKHFAVFLDWKNNSPRFIGNIDTGVEIIEKKKIEDFAQKFDVTAVERFSGSETERKNAIQRALKKVGEKAYNLVFNNCEHFKNWVLNGKSSSKQVENVSIVTLTSGLGLFLIGNWSGNKSLEKAGKIVLIALLIVFLLALFSALGSQQKNTE